VQAASAGTCNATGRLLVDDGEVLDYDGLQNRYAFNFSSECAAGSEATQITLRIERTATAASAPATTANDNLGKIVIYNTNSKSFDMAADYALSVAWADAKAPATVLPVHAEFNPAVNQTVFAGVGSEKMALGLYNMTSITFTKVPATARDGYLS
jgi:hypothetical protein